MPPEKIKESMLCSNCNAQMTPIHFEVCEMLTAEQRGFIRELLATPLTKPQVTKLIVHFIGFKHWAYHLKKVARKNGFRGQIDVEAYRPYFNDGSFPEDAFNEDLSNA